MRLSEAYNIIGLSQAATQEDVKKQYKKLAKEFHPDRNKEPGAEDKFKKINEAYEFIKSGKADNEQMNPFDSFSIPTHIELNTKISFKESIFGCKRDVSYNRTNKCNPCNGQGEIIKNNGCKNCGGSGKTVIKNANTVFVQTCNKCYGRNESDQCKDCSGTGSVNVNTSVNVNIPGGVSDGNILRLNGMGNYFNGFMSLDQFTDVHLVINVTPEQGFSLYQNNVLSTLDLSLLESLTGCTKKIKTLENDVEVNISPMSKHKDEIFIPKMGVNHIGNQIVKLNIIYPNNINKLIEVLQEKE